MKALALLLAGCTSGAVLTPLDAGTTACTGDEVALTRAAPPNLFLIVDRSSPALGSWDLVTQAFQQYFSSNTAGVKWGLLLVPHRNGGCAADPVDVALSDSAGSAIVATITDPFNQPVGTLPLRDAIALAQSQMTSGYLIIVSASSARCAVTCSCPPGWTVSSGGGICYHPGDNYAQVCGEYDYAGAASAVTAAFHAGLHSYVISVDVTDPGTQDGLAELARLGGEGAPFAVASAADLVSALGNIAGPLADCSWLLPRPATADELHVTVDGLAVARDPAHANGWDLSPDGVTVRFFGQWCTSLRTGVFSMVRARYGCPPIP